MEGGGFFPLGGDPEEILRGLREFAETQSESVKEAQREQFATLTLSTAVELTAAALKQIEPAGGPDEQAVGELAAVAVIELYHRLMPHRRGAGEVVRREKNQGLFGRVTVGCDRPGVGAGQPLVPQFLRRCQTRFSRRRRRRRIARVQRAQDQQRSDQDAGHGRPHSLTSNLATFSNTLRIPSPTSRAVAGVFGERSGVVMPTCESVCFCATGNFAAS